MISIVIENIEYTAERIKKSSVLQEKSLSNSELAMDSITVTISSNDRNIMNVKQNAPVVYKENGLVRGTFYKQEISRIGKNEYTIYALSALSVLSSMQHYGGIYTGQTVGQVVSDICKGVSVRVKSNYADIKLYGWLPFASARDNLLQVLFAIGATIGTDMNGVLRIENLWDGVSSVLLSPAMYQGGQVQYNSAVSAVQVTEHSYSLGTTERKLFDGTAAENDLITFSEPMHDLVADGVTILESGANYARISAGTGTLRGQTYTHNTRIITAVSNEGVPENVVDVTNATLVSLVNSNAIATRLAKFYKNQEIIVNKVLTGKERPGHIVRIYHPYDQTMVDACVQSKETIASVAMAANLTARVGFMPDRPETTDNLTQRVIVTASGTVQIPEGAKNARIVIGGGGDGGTGGHHGTAGTKGQDVSGKSGEIGGSGGTPGKGGSPGTVGSGGRVNIVDVNIDGVSSISVSIGAGGAGSNAVAYDASEIAGGKGAASTVTINEQTYSSDSGSVSDDGYTDVVTGDVFSRKGNSGLSGGKGGEAGNMNDQHGKSGEDAGNASGGKGADTSYGYESSQKDTDGKYIYLTKGWMPSGGGGAAYSADGGNAKQGTGETYNTIVHGYGGTGANAVAASNASIPGSGGNAGSGGGGGGAGGGGYISVWPKTKSWPTTSTATGDEGGAAGLGSRGGDGAPGYVIIYFGISKTVPSGQMATSDRKWFLDRHGRRIIV